MSAPVQSLQIYETLAGWYDRQGQAKLRDWFLLLAADTAQTLGENVRAESIHKQLLHVNPHHLLKPFTSFADASKSTKVKRLVTDLRNQYPLETAEQLLKTIKRKVEQTRQEVKRPTKAETGATPPPPTKSRLRPEPTIKFVSHHTPPKSPSSNGKYQLALKWRKPRRNSMVEPIKTIEDVTTEDQESMEQDSLSLWVSNALVILTLVAGLGLALVSLAGPLLAR